MRENVIKIRSFGFALKVIRLYKMLAEEKKEFILSKQMMRSGTAIGALVREAQQAESKKDFIHKLSIALKEADETDYWLELLYQSGYITKGDFLSWANDLKEILKLLTSIIKTTKANIN